MPAPRRRFSILSIVLVVVFTFWYFNYSPDLTSESTSTTGVISDHEASPGNLENARPSATLSESVAENELQVQPGSAEDALPSFTTESEPQIPLPKVDDVSPDITTDSSPAPTQDGTSIGKWQFVEKYPVTNYKSFSNDPLPTLPRLQYDFAPESDEERESRLERLKAVKESFEHSWEGYKKFAWMKDELSPLDGSSASTFGGWAATLVDTLDTLWIMDLRLDFEKAIEAVKDIDFTSPQAEYLNVFETTIRYLGGFLGAYDISGGNYPVLLRKAIEVGDFLYCAFDTPNRMPATRWKWQDALAGEDQRAGDYTLVAEIGSLTLEFTRLSQLTGDMKYYDAIQRITDELDKAQSLTKLPGLWPIVINAERMTFTDTGFTLGGMADSLYEYLPKQYMLLGGRESQMERMYNESLTAALEHIFFRPMVPDNKDILISGDAQVLEFSEGNHTVVNLPKGQHLGCFTGGMVGVGAKIFEQPHMNIARKLVDGCIWAYDSMPSGIMPEVFFMSACNGDDCDWDEKKWHQSIVDRAAVIETDETTPQSLDDEDKLNSLIETKRLKPGYINYADTSYGLRPEAIESIFIHYRLTGEKDLLDAAWRMFTAIEKQTRTEYANAMISDVTVEDSQKINKMESYWLAETLKYFYLMYSEPDVVSLDDYVL